MRKRLLSRITATALAILAAGASTAFAGKDYIKARKLLRRGDPKGIAAMEKVCKKEPFASNAWLDLARGYLRVKRDPAMAMDAAVRGLEKYSDKWQYKVPKKSLYDVFAQAASKAKPEALRKYLPRIEKLAKRDGALTRPLLTKYAQHLPGVAVRRLIAGAKAAEAAKQRARALTLWSEAAKVAKAGGVEADFAKDLEHGERLLAAAQKEYDDALALAAAKKYDECFKALETVSRSLAGHELGKKAAKKLKELRASDEVKAARAAAADKVREEQAARLLAGARAHLEKKEYAKAAAAFRRVVFMKGTAAAKTAADELAKLEKDPAASAAIRAAEADKQCRSLLGMARTFKLNGMKAKARAKLDEIISKYPGTEWARKAAEELKKL
jgi:hypothetical protein